MSNHRQQLPQLGARPFLTDGGLETTLIFHEGVELAYFAAFDLLRSAEGRALLQRYYRAYAQIARQSGCGLILDSPTWRASADWGKRLGYDAAALAAANRAAIELLETIRAQYDSATTPVVVSGCIGPRGDGYVPDQSMSAAEAQAYHQAQIDTFAATTADMLCALTLNRPEEAIGIVRAAQAAGMPVAISFTLETDGRLPCGLALQDAIAQVEDATAAGPAYYMINCAHPGHFAQALSGDAPWLGRIRGVRANASKMSHAELDAACELDAGDPQELGQLYRQLCSRLPALNVLGGCCGTDTRHIEQIARACLPLFAPGR